MSQQGAETAEWLETVDHIRSALSYADKTSDELLGYLLRMALKELTQNSPDGRQRTPVK